MSVYIDRDINAGGLVLCMFAIADGLTPQQLRDIARAFLELAKRKEETTSDTKTAPDGTQYTLTK